MFCFNCEKKMIDETELSPNCKNKTECNECCDDCRGVISSKRKTAIKYSLVAALIVVLIITVNIIDSVKLTKNQITNKAKVYTNRDLQGYWNDDGIVLVFTDNNYSMDTDNMGNIEKGTFTVSGDTLVTTIKESNISKDEVGKDYSYKIEIKNETLYLDDNGSISQYEKITKEEAENIIVILPDALLFLKDMGVKKNSDGTYSFKGYVTGMNPSGTVNVRSTTTGHTFSTGDMMIYTFANAFGNSPNQEIVYDSTGYFVGIR